MRRATEAVSDFVGVPFISIHALREEGDERERHNLMIARRFQSTPSVRRATLYDGVYS